MTTIDDSSEIMAVLGRRAFVLYSLVSVVNGDVAAGVLVSPVYPNWLPEVKRCTHCRPAGLIVVTIDGRQVCSNCGQESN